MNRYKKMEYFYYSALENGFFNYYYLPPIVQYRIIKRFKRKNGLENAKYNLEKEKRKISNKRKEKRSMVRFGVKVNGVFTSHEFPTIEEAYEFYLKTYAIQSDYDYYKECCGLSIYEITDPAIMKAIFENVFEYVTGFFST